MDHGTGFGMHGGYMWLFWGLIIVVLVLLVIVLLKQIQK